MKVFEIAKKFINGAIKIFRRIKNAIKFFITPIGHILAWILIIIFVVLLLKVLADVVMESVATWIVGEDLQYSSYENDKNLIYDFQNGSLDESGNSKEITSVQLIKKLVQSGYETVIDAKNYQDFKAYEYAVLMDAAEYLRTNKSDMFDVYYNEGEYEYERTTHINNHPALKTQYEARLKELKKTYTNVGEINDDQLEHSAMPLLTVDYKTNQSNISDDSYQKALQDGSRNVIASGINETGSGRIRGGNNRVQGPYLVYEVKENKIATSNNKEESQNGASSQNAGSDSIAQIAGSNVDVNRMNKTARRIWDKYSQEIIWASNEYGIDPFVIIGVIISESDGKLDCISWNKSHTGYAFGLMQIYGTESDGHIQNHITQNVNEEKITLDASEEGTRGNAQKQIAVGTADLRKHSNNNDCKYNILRGICHYNEGHTTSNWNKWFNSSYYTKIRNACYPNGEDAWMIKKVAEGQYVRVYVSTVTGEFTGREEPASWSPSTFMGSNITDGTLEPYIYVIKENITFDYLFDDAGQIIECSALLNAYNPDLKGNEKTQEAYRATMGLNPVVWPDELKDLTKTACYFSDNKPTVYKIPLRTIIGRYMPKAELLLSWSMLKQNIEGVASNREAAKGIVDNTISAIKGIYNYSCLFNEETEVEEKVYVDAYHNDNKEGEKERYSKYNTNNSTFVTFQKVGLESTRYSVGSYSAENKGKKIRIVTGMEKAYIFNSEFYVTYDFSANYTNRNGDTIIIGEVKDKVFSVNAKEYKLSNADHDSRVIAYGSEELGYTPPSSLDGEMIYYTTDDNRREQILKEIESQIKDDILKTIDNGQGIIDNISEDQINLSINNLENSYIERPLYVISEFEIGKELRVNHIRMPALLVSGVSSWCRFVYYNHNITQNQFKQYDKKYIIPKSVTSIGLTSFTTTASIDDYRGKAYEKTFATLNEKDVTNMLIYLSTAAKYGSNDAYEFARDLYRLANASLNYSQDHPDKTNNEPLIPASTFKYMYLEDSVRCFDDVNSQKMYWLELLTATENDPITDDELKNFRTKNNRITWQVLDYEKYPECTKDGITYVYALFPFGSEFVRTNYATTHMTGGNVSGNFGNGHGGADLHGRAIISRIKNQGEDALDVSKINGQIYDYELNRYKLNLGETNAIEALHTKLQEEEMFMPLVSVAPGKVISVSYDARSGFYVSVQHSEEENGVVTKYMHMKRWPLVKVGDIIGAGTVLGYEGTTGRSTGNHLHFEVHISGDVKAPADYLFPMFTPFYNEEKAKFYSYNLKSEYMSLYRTVYMVGEGVNEKTINQIGNDVPETPLLTYDKLIKDDKKSTEYAGFGISLGWAGIYVDSSLEDFIENLRGKEKMYDLSIPEAAFNMQLAGQQGYLSMNSQLLSYLYANGLISYYSGLLGIGQWFGENTNLINCIKNCDAFYRNNNFDYCQAGDAGRMIPPYDESQAINGDFSQLSTIQKSVRCCGTCGQGDKSGFHPRTDCSTYVTWVIYEYAKSSGLTELQGLCSHQINSAKWNDIGSNILQGKTDGICKYFDIAWSLSRGDSPFTNNEAVYNFCEPGDLLVEYTGLSGVHHVEFYVGKENGDHELYSCGLYDKNNLKNEQRHALKYILRLKQMPTTQPGA